MEITKIGPVYCSSEEYIAKRASNFIENGLEYVWGCGHFGSSCVEVVGTLILYSIFRLIYFKLCLVVS